MKNRLFKIVATCGILISSLSACKPNPAAFSTVMSSACYSCTFPLTISGITLLQGTMHDPAPSIRTPICACSDPFPRIGIPISYFEPSRMVEVVSDPYCFPTLGAGISGVGATGTLAGSKPQSGTTSKRTFMQSHYVVFPLYTILEVIMDGACLEGSSPDMAYISEVDPLWNSDTLSAFMQPEALLFGNPVTNLACVADSVGTSVGNPIDLLFWCMGSWGNSYPLTGSKPTNDSYIENVAGIASKMLYKLHRQLLVWSNAGVAGLCGKYPMPIWKKTNFRLQMVLPVPHPIGMTIGQTGIKWGTAKTPPMSFDNFSFMLFKKRDCCVL